MKKWIKSLFLKNIVYLVWNDSGTYSINWVGDNPFTEKFYFSYEIYHYPYRLHMKYKLIVEPSFYKAKGKYHVAPAMSSGYQDAMNKLRSLQESSLIEGLILAEH